MTRHSPKTAWMIVWALGISVTVASSASAAAVEGREPGGTIEPVALIRVSMEQGKKELGKLHSLGLRTLQDFAGAQQSTVASVVGAARAQRIIDAAMRGIGPTSIINPNWVVDPTFIVNPMFVVDPTFRTDPTTRNRVKTAAAQLAQIKAKGIHTLAHVASVRSADNLRSVVGRAKAAKMQASAQSAITWTGIINPNWVIDPSFVVDPAVIVPRTR